MPPPGGHLTPTPRWQEGSGERADCALMEWLSRGEPLPLVGEAEHVGVLVGGMGRMEETKGVSFKALERVLRQSRQEGSSLAAMLILAHKANGDSVCWPKVGVLAEELKLGVRGTQYLLRRLEQAGEIAVRPGGKHGVSSNCYLVTVGDPEVGWPEKVRGKGCNLTRERVHSGDATGAKRRNGRVQSEETDREGVQPAAPTGARECTPYKEIELTTELTDSSVSGTGQVPDELRDFDAELRGLPAYLPTRSFFERVLANYAELDLVEEAIAIRDWFDRPTKKFKGKTPREAGERCSNSRVLRWLRKAKEQREAGHVVHGAAIGRAGGDQASDGVEAGEYVPRLRERWDPL